MCGFHGNTTGHLIGREALSHRGPDHYGLFRDGNVVLEHWRLSIIDLSPNANQPMSLPADPMRVIAYNGEVYNFKTLRNQIPDSNKSSGDTEVVLRLYRQYGVEFLSRLNGMFALAIYDKAERCIILARDRFGIKPLYYHVDASSGLHFASELQALLLNSRIAVTLDAEAIQSLFHLLYIEGERTPFNEFKKLPPGSYLRYDIDSKAIEITRYHEFQSGSDRLSESECIDGIEELLADSVKMHLVSDVPVGALLSGGVDSSLMVALMRKYSSDLLTFSVGHADNERFDESKYFNAVASQYGTTHHHTVVHEKDIDILVQEVCAILDEPIGDTSIFLNYFIFRFASKSVKVCLSGLGGDELFGGYNRYLACKAVPGYLRTPKVLRDALLSGTELLRSSRRTRAGNAVRLLTTFMRSANCDLGGSYRNFIDYFFGLGSPIRSGGDFANARFQAYWEDDRLDELDRIYRFDIENYMVNDLLFLTDRMSMRHSLEVRVPYLENRLADFALRIPSEMKIRGMTLKYLLKRVAQRHLPKDVIFRPKRGFSAPISALLTARVLAELACEIAESSEEYVAILDRPLLLSVIERHGKGEDFSLQLFTLFIYLRWMDICYRRIKSRSNG